MKANRKSHADLFVGDYGTDEIPKKVISKYHELFFRKRAPKKSSRDAASKMESDLAAIQRFCWIMGMDGTRLPK